ncbi:hypothetical protein P615_23165 [Brevibacillus laterosporus PE36]|nr:hypothetical protein P615_23165 [Brevibacillus laterosporus PE36]
MVGSLLFYKKDLLCLGIAAFCWANTIWTKWLEKE